MRSEQIIASSHSPRATHEFHPTDEWISQNRVMNLENICRLAVVVKKPISYSLPTTQSRIGTTCICKRVRSIKYRILTFERMYLPRPVGTQSLDFSLEINILFSTNCVLNLEKTRYGCTGSGPMAYSCRFGFVRDAAVRDIFNHESS